MSCTSAQQQSDFAVALNVQRVHLLQDERDRVLTYDADVTLQRLDLLLL